MDQMVGLFHEVLVWPLRLIGEADAKDAQTEHNTLEAFSKTICRGDSKWKPTDGVFHLKTGASENTKYAERLYFYPFIQDILYNESRLRVLERVDITGVQVEFWQAATRTPRRIELDVLRVNLYLTHLGVALLVVEVRGTNLTFDDVLDIQDRLRRAYTPYWDNGHAGHCPDRVQWLHHVNRLNPSSDYGADTHGAFPQLEFLKTHKKPPVAAHWKFLLEPMLPESAVAPRIPNTLYFQQVQDDRMPAMCFVAVDDPWSISPPDQIRLCFLDGSGQWEYPYAKDFLKTFDEKHCYDRFWQVDQDHMHSRMFCCGYAFTILGKSTDPFFGDEQSGLLAHFRHHYLHLGLVAQLQLATLLAFSNRLSGAARAAGDVERFNRQVQAIQRDFADFVSGVWFHSITSQLQGQEMFHVWTRHLGSNQLFQEVTLELETVSNILTTNLEQSRNESMLRLSQVATIALPLGLVISFWGMNMEEAWCKFKWPHFAVSIIAAVVIILILFHREIQKYGNDRDNIQ